MTMNNVRLIREEEEGLEEEDPQDGAEEEDQQVDSQEEPEEYQLEEAIEEDQLEGAIEEVAGGRRSKRISQRKLAEDQPEEAGGRRSKRISQRQLVEEAGISLEEAVDRSTLKCANERCKLAVHSNPRVSLKYCCRRCGEQSNTRKNRNIHGKWCEGPGGTKAWGRA
jgi:hypothetical protein